VARDPLVQPAEAWPCRVGLATCEQTYWITIVGVIANARTESLANGERSASYLSRP